MSRRVRRVAVLGAGIMGCSVAIFLARRGFEVTLVDQAAAPFSGASRWNEGKIHLGYLYSGDPSLATAHKLIDGGLRFKPLVEKLTGFSFADHVTARDELYLVHRDTVVAPDIIERYLHAVAELVRKQAQAGGYLVDASQSAVRPLSRNEIEAVANPERVVAGFEVCERSVDTRWIADHFVEAVAAQAGIVQAMDTRVVGVQAAQPREGWHLNCRPSLATRFDAVVNALWEGSVAVDSTVGLAPDSGWLHRFRLCLFIRTARRVEMPSALLATGPFGDVKNYDGWNFYLSWYDAGLLAQGDEVDPPPAPKLDPSAREAVAEAIAEGVGAHFPAARAVMENAVERRLEGGWVFAIGAGALADRSSTLHSRHRFGVRRLKSYFSVNTGKYSTAPWLARRLADEISSMLH